MQQFTKEEVNKKFKEAKVKFTNYWKYTFTFEGDFENYHIQVSYGGDSSDIYRYDVDDMPVNFNAVEDWSLVQITDNNTNNLVFQEHTW